MVKLLLRLIATIAANAFALFLAERYISGFELSASTYELALIALTLTALNIVVRPILKLLLGPFVILTLGLGLIVINAATIYILDIITENLTILNIPALFYVTLLVGVLNFIVHLLLK
jgi:putative membrane protein